MLQAHIEEVTQELLSSIKAATPEPVALEALWDGDTEGWFLVLSVVVRDSKGLGSPRYQSHFLKSLHYGSDFRLFTGSVPPWPEAVVARQAGQAVAERLGIPFWFPSPDTPDDDCPSWWQQDQAVACSDCAKPIIPSDSAYRLKDVCYSCQLERERQEKLRKDAPRSTINRGIICVVHKGDKFVRGPSFHNWSRAGRLIELTTQLGRPIDPLQDVILTPGETQAFRSLLVQRLDALLTRYVPPDERRKRIQREETILGTTVWLDRASQEHEELSELHDFFLMVERCTGEEVLSFFVNAGVGRREFELLGFLRQQEGQEADLASLAQALPELGDSKDILWLARNLQTLGCVSSHGEIVRLTFKGSVINVSEG